MRSMWPSDYVLDLADICIRQAEIIKAQAEVIQQLGGQALEDGVLAARLKELVG